MIVYISGPVSGRPDFNRPAFASAARVLKAKGHDPVSPFDTSPYHPRKKWIDYMLDDIPAMLRCEAVAVLPGWIRSRGARIEVVLAWALGMKIMFLGRRPV